MEFINQKKEEEEMKKKNKRNKLVTYLSKPPLPFECHLTEIYPNLFIGSYSDWGQMVKDKKVDVLIPLSRLDGDVWRYFRGEILYYPIKDYGILPKDVLNDLINKIIQNLKKKKKIGIFCEGGHGRTGYVTAMFLVKIGYKDPIAYVRSHYCNKAIESNQQIKDICDALGSSKMYDKYKIIEKTYDNNFYNQAFLDDDIFMDYYGYR